LPRLASARSTATGHPRPRPLKSMRAVLGLASRARGAEARAARCEAISSDSPNAADSCTAAAVGTVGRGFTALLVAARAKVSVAAVAGVSALQDS